MNAKQARECANEIAWMESRATDAIFNVLRKYGGGAERKPVATLTDGDRSYVVCDDGAVLQFVRPYMTFSGKADAHGPIYDEVAARWEAVTPIPGTAADLAGGADMRNERKD